MQPDGILQGLLHLRPEPGSCAAGPIYKKGDGSACPKASYAFADLLAADSAGKIRCPLGYGARHRALGHS
jgi:hypothetical protein